MITVDHLTHDFGSAAGSAPTLNDISLTVADGEFVALVGPSGCGKTTLLNIIAGLEHEQQPGAVRIDGEDPRAGNRQVGYMLSRDCLLPSRRALANAALGLEIARVPRAQRLEAAKDALTAVGLADFLDSYPAQLSQGMRQRVALARVFATKPKVLLLDEPFSALDAQTRISVQDAFLGLWQEREMKVVLVTHDLSEAITLADRVVVMSRRPARIKADHRIDLPRPRSAAELRSTPEFHRLYEEIWADLKDEIIAADADELSGEPALAH
jgi:NitT/TauT family transport system ATP-binding protein